MQASRLTAIGGVLLAAAVVMIEDRMEDTWSHGAHFALAIGAFVLLFALALIAKPEAGPRPTAAQSALIVSGLAVLVAAVVRFGQVAGQNSPGDHAATIAWMALVYAVIAAYPAFRLGSAICTLVASLSLGLAFVEFAHVLFNADRPNAFRWLFLIVIVIYVAAVAFLRARQPRDAAQLVNAAMVGVVAILGTIGFGIDFGDDVSGPSLSTWWELVALAVPLAAIGYALLTRERGPAWSGSAALLLSVLVVGEPETVITSTHGSLKGWPIVLLALAAVTLGGGLVTARRT